jgi:hypothetical protein
MRPYRPARGALNIGDLRVETQHPGDHINKSSQQDAPAQPQRNHRRQNNRRAGKIGAPGDLALTPGLSQPTHGRLLGSLVCIAFYRHLFS